MTPITKRPRHAAAGGGQTGPTVVVNRPSETRDWAGLLPELVSKISDHVVHNDLADYIRMRAVCEPWRSCTEHPKLFQPRYFPRNWLLLIQEVLHDDGKPEHFVNVRTGEILRIRLPDPREYTYHGNTEGLLILHHTMTDTVCLLNPLTMLCVDLPGMVAVYDVVRPCDDDDQDEMFFADSITAAGIIVDMDDKGRALSWPTIVLSLTAGTCTAIVSVKFGENSWTAVEHMDCGCQFLMDDMPSVQGGGICVRGRFYVPTFTGDVLTVELEPYPRLIYVARMTGDLVRSDTEYQSSYLVPSLDDTDSGMILVRALVPDGNLGCTEFAVDVRNGSIAMKKLSDITVFLPSVTLRCSPFPLLPKKNAVLLEKSHIKKLLRGYYI